MKVYCLAVLSRESGCPTDKKEKGFPPEYWFPGRMPILLGKTLQYHGLKQQAGEGQATNLISRVSVASQYILIINLPTRSCCCQER